MSEEINFNEIDGEELDAMKQEAASHKLEKEEQKEASKVKEEVEKAGLEKEEVEKEELKEKLSSEYQRLREKSVTQAPKTVSLEEAQKNKLNLF